MERVSVGKGKYQIKLTAIITMDGLIISILGGTKPHVGAIAVSIPRPSLMDETKISTTTSVYVLVGHKDDEIAKPAAERVAKNFNQTTIVIAGVHIDRAKEEDIRKLMHNSMKAVESFIRKLSKYKTNCAHRLEMR